MTDKTATIEGLAVRCIERRKLMGSEVPDADFETMLIAEEADFYALAERPARHRSDLKVKARTLKAAPYRNCVAGVALRNSIRADLHPARL